MSAVWTILTPVPARDFWAEAQRAGWRVQFNGAAKVFKWRVITPHGSIVNVRASEREAIELAIAGFRWRLRGAPICS